MCEECSKPIIVVILKIVPRISHFEIKILVILNIYLHNKVLKNNKIRGKKHDSEWKYLLKGMVKVLITGLDWVCGSGWCNA